jgi:hypothetical protein
MVRENHRGRQCGARGGGVRPLVASTLEGSNNQGEDKVIGEENIVCRGCGWVDDVLSKDVISLD